MEYFMFGKMRSLFLIELKTMFLLGKQGATTVLLR